MSLLNKASLIQIPSGYKDGTLYSAKPTNGDGDFTFSRGSNLAATRVNSEGLIEKGRENLLLQSNSFSTSPWESNQANREAVVSSGEQGYDGTNDAWLVLDTTGSGLHQIAGGNLTLSGVNTASVYAKAYANSRYLGLAGFGLAGGNEMPVFDLENGTIDMPSTSSILKDATITSVGNGWYRCSMTFLFSGTSTFSITLCNTATNNGLSAYSYTGTGTNGFYIQDAQLEVGLVATDYIETTTTTAQAGILEDMPRLDYSGGATCPSLLLEPQRTNLFAYSEAFDQWNADASTVTANATTSPDGTQNADAIISLSGTSYGRYLNLSSSTGVYTFSVYAKANGFNYAKLVFSGAASTDYAVFNLTNGTIAGGTYTSATISEAANGFYRCTITTTINTTTTSAYLWMSDGTINRTAGVSGDGVKGIYVYGGQFEAGSYPTSYIPTYGGSSVTRSADSCSKTGISSLIGQTEGTIFYDGYFGNQGNEVYFFIQDSLGTSITSSIFAQKLSSSEIVYRGYNSSNVLQWEIIGNGYSIGQRIKIGGGYKSNDIVLYINGTQIGVDTSASIPTCTSLQLGTYPANPVANNNISKPINEVILFPTRLTNDELAYLTTI